jgi:4-nitrophenyl phosphatase
MANIKPNDIKALILDMDGVIWEGDRTIGNLPEIFKKINANNWRVVLATNNATRSPDQYIQKLREYGVHLNKWQILNSAQTAASYLQSNFPQGSPVYIIGETGLFEAVLDYGFSIEEQPNHVVAVVVGLDRTVTYEKLKFATLLIREGAVFIGTNPDKTLPTPIGLVPGAGSILAAIEAATDVKPIIIGKPRPEIYNLAMERLMSRPEETLVVGDRLETDILGAQTCGCRTAIVLSGVSTEDQVDKWQPIPDIIANDLSEIVFEILT